MLIWKCLWKISELVNQKDLASSGMQIVLWCLFHQSVFWLRCIENGVSVLQMHLKGDKEETVKNIISFAGVFYGTVNFYRLQY